MHLSKKDKIIIFSLVVLILLAIYIYYNKQENLDESQKLLRDMIVKNILSTNMSITYKDKEFTLNLQKDQFDYYNINENRYLSLLIITDTKIYLIGRTINYTNANSDNMYGITVFNFVNPQDSYQYLTKNMFLISYDKQETITLKIINLNKRDENGNQLTYKFIINTQILDNPDNIMSMVDTNNVRIKDAILNDTQDPPVIYSNFNLTNLDIYTQYKKELSQMSQKPQPQSIMTSQKPQIQPQSIMTSQKPQTQTQSIMVSSQKPQNICKDLNNNCASWAKTNECMRNPLYMLKNCPDSCKSCNLTPEVMNIIQYQHNKINTIKEITNKD